MDLSVIAFLILLFLVAALRLVELRISRRHQRQLVARGAARVDEPRFRWMVLLHTAVLVGAALEVVFLKRPFIPALAAVMFAIFLAAKARALVGHPHVGRSLERSNHGLHTPRGDHNWSFSLRSAS